MTELRISPLSSLNVVSGQSRLRLVVEQFSLPICVELPANY